MSSWGFLIKRIIHTIITLLIVLVLLFIIFRLMPGDPTTFFIEPGQDPQTRHLYGVRYGFEKEELVPGNIYDTDVDSNLVGAYGMRLNVSDASGSEANYYGVFNKPGILVVDANTSLTNVSISPIPSMNDNIDVNMQLACTPPPCPSQIQVNITHGGMVFETLDLDLDSSTVVGSVETADYSGTTTGTISEFGNYFVRYEVEDQTGNALSNVYGISVNTDASGLLPFTIQNLMISESQTVESSATVQLTSTSDIRSVSLNLNSPKDTEVELTMQRSTRFVPVPYWEQFLIYMKNMLSLDFGNSFVSNRPVWSELSQRIPPTLLLFGTALILSAILGILIGAIMAWRRGSKLEIGGIVVGLFFYSMPIFWFGLILLVVFSFHLEWFPLRGMLTPGANYVGLDYVKDVLWHLTLPLITLTMGSLAGWLLLMRNSMLEVMGEDYITTAKAKGLSERKVMYRHAARNAMLPIVTAMALGLSHVIGGGVLTETIFSWPGMGQYLVQSTYAYDFPAVQGAFFLLAILTIIANMLADLLYSYLDPRVRLTR
jgi:peptide/nickel transport system permease protein